MMKLESPIYVFDTPSRHDYNSFYRLKRSLFCSWAYILPTVTIGITIKVARSTIIINTAIDATVTKVGRPIFFSLSYREQFSVTWSATPKCITFYYGVTAEVHHLSLYLPLACKDYNIGILLGHSLWHCPSDHSDNKRDEHFCRLNVPGVVITEFSNIFFFLNFSHRYW